MRSHKKRGAAAALATVALLVHVVYAAGPEPPGPQIIAIASMSGLYADFATQTAGLLENGVPGNRLGGLGSGLAHLGGEYFVALPDRGPNAVPYNSCLDDTVSYINRFHTFSLNMAPSGPYLLKYY